MIVPSSVGILAVTSGICFFLWTKNFRKRKGAALNEAEKKTTVDDSRCACCLKPFFIGRGVECNNCNSRSCSKGCSRWDTDENIWLCLFCHHRRSWLKKNEKWFETFGGSTFIGESINQFSTAKSQVCITGTEHVALNSGLDLAAGGYEERNTMESVRELIENIVENLVGNVDSTPINRLYGHSAYDRLFNEYSTQLAGALTHLAISLQSCIANKPATETPSMAQTALRELVERAVDEARKLPGLGESVSTTTQNNASIDEQSYEDLLATAILNKVIEKYQKEHIDGNSNVVHEKSSRKCKHVKKKLEEGLNENEDSSSLESSMSHDECSSDCSGKKIRKRHVRQDSLSLTIEEQIEEITTLYTSDEDPGCMKTNALNFQCARRVPFPEFGMDIVDPSQESSDESHDETDGSAHVDHITPVESWEENWLFQKKKISIQSDPVTMLVPNPSADYRALIGDKDAEDTSDLSEFSAHSDDEVEDELIEAINCVIPKSSKTEDITLTADIDEQILIKNDGIYSKDEDTKFTDAKRIPPMSCNQSTREISINKDIIQSNESIINIPVNDNLIISPTINEKNNIEDNNNELNSELNLDELTKLDYSKNHEIPKTPAPSPDRNSFCENNSSAIGLCDVEKLNEKLVSIDRSIEEPPEAVRECREAVTNPKTYMTSQFLEQEKIHESNLQLSSPPRPGTIAEREHKKWENAPPIQNNPYSQENIEKRLLERQYSRRPSDVNGNSAVLPTTPCPSLQIVIGSNRPDIKRFGRDYYINESKSPTGERPYRSGTSISSRPSSSLSHHSNSTGSDFEQQNFEPIEAASKSLELKQNNDILERERKNSKNEINAKLNNQGNFDSIATIFDAKKTFADDNKRKIRRIDLRAYGFENEFNINNEDVKKKQQRIPNKLDLRLYGYDSGLRRTQSNNQIDSKVNNSFLKAKTKSELINGNFNFSHQRYGSSTDDDYNWTQSTENLIEEKKMAFEKFSGIKSAKSVPNIAKSIVYSYDENKEQSVKSGDEADDEDIEFNEQIPREYEKSHQNGNTKIHSSTEMINDGATDSTNDVYNYESDSLSIKTASTDELPPKYATLKELKYSLESLEDSDTFIDKELAMPSVKVLAQAFNKPPALTDKSKSRIPRSTGHLNKERPTTPEIQIIGTPRQMHSLTARSISREFREGLRQITNKSNIPPINTTVIEQSKIPAGSPKLDTDELDGDINTDIIAPGKLKNNIQFWEQLQKKH